MSMCAYLLNLLLTLCVLRNVCSNCVFQNGKYDLSSLDRPSGWPVAGTNINGTMSYFQISLCRPLNYTSVQHKGCSKSSICLISNNTSISYGGALESKSAYAIADNIISGFSLYVLTQALCNDGKYRSTIKFACGPNLGAPVLLIKSECQVNFFWRTSAACAVKPKNQQVPCYVLDDKGSKRDLSPLIKNDDGYNVITRNPNLDFVINVCSDLSINNAKMKCPQNVSACRVKGKEIFSFGSLFDELKYTPEGLLLTYKALDSSPLPPDCQLKPKTTILFKCPFRGFSQPPKLISDSNCQYEVVWETEYACSESLLKGNIKSCQFTHASHGVDIDLNPLRKIPVYNVSGSNSTYFTLSVCGGLGNLKCGGKNWKSISVCVFNTSSNTSTVGGITDSSELIYADNEVILRYVKGDSCNGGEQSTVINFVCDKNAPNDGDGEPIFVETKSNCSHVFEWHTKHACLKHPLDIPCYVTYNKRAVNLQKLLIEDGETAWEAIDGAKHAAAAEYFLNVCGQVSKLSNLAKCGEGSAACLFNDKGEYLNLGNFTSPPIYDSISDSVQLHYSGGSPCKNNKYWHSTIEFICKSGHINSAPVLTGIDETECHYKFEWQTAAACPIGLIEGQNCKVYDTTIGINYDLTPLMSKTYNISSDKYEFYMGVCEDIIDSPCSNDKNSSSNIGICQVDNFNKSWKTGEANSRLSYMDGVVNLTYLSGDPYNGQNGTERVSIIIFICDYHAEKGYPNFVEEVNFAYVFHWYTNLVCPSLTSIKCVAHDPFSHLIYDLSELSTAKKNWMTVIDEHDKNRKLYINVCRSLAFPTSCDPTAAACLVELDENGDEKAVISNLGRFQSPPVLVGPGHLSLTYHNGDHCVAFGKNITYSTVMHFLCAEDKRSRTGFQFLNKIGACEYTILWTTKAACPTGNLLSNECQLYDPESGFNFDLMTLHRTAQPFIVDLVSGGSYQLNICGKVENGCLTSDGNKQTKNISVCEVDSNGKLISNLAVSDSYYLSYSNGKDLTLTYKSVDEKSKDVVMIKFPCFNSSNDLSPKFIRYEDGQYIFELKTSLTCIPDHFDCNIIDIFGNEYDFSPLAKYSDGNWEISDNRDEFKNLRYHINFCRPLNKVTSYKCPGGSSFACQTNVYESESIGHDLGSWMEEPKASGNGTIVFRYTGGSLCHDGKFRHSTRITLFCSAEERELKFIGETPECEYIFSLDTPVACPLQSYQGSNCMVKDPFFNYVIDLNPLKSKNNNYNVTAGEYNFAFNVCDKLNGFNNICANSSVCQLKPKDPNFSKSLGLPNDVLVYRKGVITLEYKSGTGNCHGKYNRTTKITFTCHHGHEDKDGPIFITEAENCTYLFEWPTVHACPPFDIIECSVIDNNGTYYDLSPLSLPDKNYYVKDFMTDKKTYVINVCRSVVQTPDLHCPYTSAACLIDSSFKGNPVDLGQVHQAPYFKDDKIIIRYANGDHCKEDSETSARFMETVIQFSCDSSRIDSNPEYIGRDGCIHYFDWATAYACPSKQSKTNSACSVTDPVTGHIFNLSSLKNHGLFKTKHAGHEYYLNVCGNNDSSPCDSNTGMCQVETSGEKRHWSGGQFNTNLTYSYGVLYLNYTNGYPCHNNQFHRNTLIEFQCGHGIGEPHFMYESYDCTYFFSWKTELACQELMHCAVRNLSVYYDLTTLAESHHLAASSVPNDNASYYISVCNSLENIPGVFCPPNAAICRVTKDPETSLPISESLGKVEHPPFVDFMDQATAIYSNGSVCLKNRKFNNRAKIIFLCDSTAGMGEPVLLTVDEECLYIFEWRTSIMCPEKPEIPTTFTSCNYTDYSRGIHFDMTPLQKTGTKAYYEVSESKNMVFKLNICTSLHVGTKCKDAGVCGQSGNVVYNYGSAPSQKFSYDGRRLQLTFYDGDDCPSGVNGKRTSTILFVCDPAAGLGKPVLDKRLTCTAIFMWNTALVCQNMQHQCAFDIEDKHFDFNLLSSLTHNWIASDMKNNTYWINMCGGIQLIDDARGCSPTAAICMKDKSGNHMDLGMVQTMQVKLLNSTDLLLTFHNGDSCTSIHSTSTMTALSRIIMRCGNTLGQPKMVSGPDEKCVYDFVWESIMACTDLAEEVMIENDGIIKDKRLSFSFDIKEILNKTFIVNGNSTSDQYVYRINLSGGVARNTSDPTSTCAKAAVCQTKTVGSFERDIGSFDTRTFIVRGSELHLVFKSLTKPCGKNPYKNVTTLINMHCESSADEGIPKFIYESSNCDYIFEWPTIVVCSDYHRKNNGDNGAEPEPYKDIPASNHNVEIAVGVIFSIIAIMIILFIVVKPERRAAISSRFRSAFGRVSLPYFRYKRGDILTELQSDF